MRITDEPRLEEGPADLYVEHAEDKVGKSGYEYINLTLHATDRSGKDGRMFLNIFGGNIREFLESSGLIHLAGDKDIPAYKLNGAKFKGLIGKQAAPRDKYMEVKTFLPRESSAPAAVPGQVAAALVEGDDGIPF